MQTNVILYKIGLKLGITTLIVGGWLILCTLPPLNQTGIWFQSESAAAAWLLLGGTASLALSFMALKRPDRARRALMSPLAFLPLGIGGVASIAAFFTPFPGRALLGGPELGEGALTYLSLGLFSALVLALRAYPGWRKILVFNSLLVTLFAAFLMALAPMDWKPYFFSDFLAFMGLFASLGVGLFFARNKPILIISTLVFLGIIWLSHSRTAWFALLGGLAVYITYRLGNYRWKEKLCYFPPAAFLLVPLAIMILLKFVPLQDISPSIHDTLKSRLTMSKSVITALGESPKAWIFGKGLGSYSQELLIHFRSEKTSLHSINEPGGWFWDAAWRGDFHPHNQAFEILLGGGLLSLSLFLLYIFYIAKVSRNPGLGLMFATILALLWSFWFMPPTLFPLLAYTACLQAKLSPLSRENNVMVTSPILAWAGFTLFLGAAVILKQAADSRDTLNQEILLPPKCASPFNDFKRGQDHLTKIFYHRHSNVISPLRPLNSWETTSEEGDTSPKEIENLHALACIADNVKEPAAPLIIRAILLRNDLAFTPHDKLPPESIAPYKALLDYALTSWPKAYDNLLKVAPGRTDLLAPYFLWLFQEGKEKEISEKTAAILVRSSSDPVALWFSGLVMLNNQASGAQGIARMKEAINQGFEQIMPIDKETKAMLR